MGTKYFNFFYFLDIIFPDFFNSTIIIIIIISGYKRLRLLPNRKNIIIIIIITIIIYCYVPYFAAGTGCACAELVNNNNEKHLESA